MKTGDRLYHARAQQALQIGIPLAMVVIVMIVIIVVPGFRSQISDFVFLRPGT